MERITWGLSMLIVVGIGWETTLNALDLFPSDETLNKYRRSWTPSVHGSLLLPVAEAPPKGRLTLNTFTISQIGNGQYHHTLTTHVSSSSINTNAVIPGGIISYGLTDHIVICAGLSAIYWNATGDGSGNSSSSGWGGRRYL